MGRPRLSDAERERRKKESKKKWRAKQRGFVPDQKASASPKSSPKSWVKQLSTRLEAVAEPEDADEGDAPLPERPGEPFADLPPLDLPASPGAPSEDAPADSSAEGAATSTGEPKPSPSGDTSKGSAKETKGKVFDSEVLQKMAYSLGVSYMKLTGEYASARGYFAFGEDIAKVVGMACSVIVQKNAEKLEIDDEEGAAYVVALFGGANGVSAGMAYMNEKKMRKEAQAHVERDTRSKQGGPDGTVTAPPVNGVAPRPKPDERPDRFISTGAVV